MRTRLSILGSRCLLALLCTGLLGFSSCKRTFHSQRAHAIGGGRIDGGPGKKGWAAAPTREGSEGGVAKAPPGPLDQLLSGKRNKRSANAGKAATRSSQRSVAVAKRRPEGRTNPLDPGSPFGKAPARKQQSALR